MGDSKSPIPPEAGHSKSSTSPIPPEAGKAGSLLGITALVIADALSKITAVLLLPAGEPVRREAALQLVLSLNDLGLGSWARTLADRNDEFEWDLPKAVALFALAGAVLFVRGSEGHTAELQSQSNLVCRLLLGKKKLTISAGAN